MQKHERHHEILSLIDSDSIGSQSELAGRLFQNGFRVTQASISRDLDELGIVKSGGRYCRPPRPNTDTGFGSLSLDTAGDNLIVGRCASGLASAITVKIDSAQIPEIVGTIAGDDTVMIAVKDRNSQEIAIREIAGMFEGAS